MILVNFSDHKISRLRLDRPREMCFDNLAVETRVVSDIDSSLLKSSSPARRQFQPRWGRGKMDRNLEVLQRPDWFLRGQYPIQLTLLLTYTILKGLLGQLPAPGPMSRGAIKAELLQLLTASQKIGWFRGKLLEVNPYQERERFNLTDLTGTFYPLTLETPKRALPTSIRAVLSVFDELWDELSALKSTADWTLEFQTYLLNHVLPPIPYKRSQENADFKAKSCAIRSSALAAGPAPNLWNSFSLTEVTYKSQTPRHSP